MTDKIIHTCTEKGTRHEVLRIGVPDWGMLFVAYDGSVTEAVAGRYLLGHYPIVGPAIEEPPFPWTGPSGVVYGLDDEGDIVKGDSFGDFDYLFAEDLPGLAERHAKHLARKGAHADVETEAN